MRKFRLLDYGNGSGGGGFGGEGGGGAPNFLTYPDMFGALSYSFKCFNSLPFKLSILLKNCQVLYKRNRSRTKVDTIRFALVLGISISTVLGVFIFGRFLILANCLRAYAKSLTICGPTFEDEYGQGKEALKVAIFFLVREKDKCREDLKKIFYLPCR